MKDALSLISTKKNIKLLTSMTLDGLRSVSRISSVLREHKNVQKTA